MPSEIPAILIFPRKIPMKITTATNKIECPIPDPKNNSDSHSIIFE